MSDLIQRQDAVSRMSDLLMMELKGQRLPTWNEVYQAMNDVPSAEPERKKGQWSNYKDEHCCSVCKCVVISDCWNDEIRYDYCPYCGAEME